MVASSCRPEFLFPDMPSERQVAKVGFVFDGEAAIGSESTQSRFRLGGVQASGSMVPVMAGLCSGLGSHGDTRVSGAWQPQVSQNLDGQGAGSGGAVATWSWVPLVRAPSFMAYPALHKLLLFQEALLHARIPSAAQSNSYQLPWSRLDSRHCF